MVELDPRLWPDVASTAPETIMVHGTPLTLPVRGTPMSVPGPWAGGRKYYTQRKAETADEFAVRCQEKIKGFSPRLFILARRISHFALGQCERCFARRVRESPSNLAVWRPVRALGRLQRPQMTAVTTTVAWPIRRSCSFLKKRSARS